MGSEPTPLSSIISTVLDGQMAKPARAQTRAARAWFVANGDRERAHTTGVWTRPGPFEGADPVLCVAVDSGLLAQELSCNKEIYLSRLAYAGVAISDIRFSVRARPREEVKSVSKKEGCKAETFASPHRKRDEAGGRGHQRPAGRSQAERFTGDVRVFEKK